jgi:hypothetical protein
MTADDEGTTPALGPVLREREREKLSRRRKAALSAAESDDIDRDGDSGDRSGPGGHCGGSAGAKTDAAAGPDAEPEAKAEAAEEDEEEREEEVEMFRFSACPADTPAPSDCGCWRPVCHSDWEGNGVGSGADCDGCCSNCGCGMVPAPPAA